MLLDNLRKKMNLSFENLIKEFGGLRTGRASVTLLDSIMVEAYGNMVPLQQVGTINAPESRLLTVQVWDSSLIKPVEVAIRNSPIGLSPVVEGQVIRISIPNLSEERRKEICKIASKFSEQTRVAIRNVRREGMETIKKQEKAKEITTDDAKRENESIQKLTDEFIKKIDNALDLKEKEIMKV